MGALPSLLWNSLSKSHIQPSRWVFAFSPLGPLAEDQSVRSVLGAATFFGMGLFNLGFLIWWLIARDSLSGGQLLFFLGLMIGKSSLYLAAAAAFAFSTQIKNYFHGEEQLFRDPPPPPEFAG
jgi:hypothetical protein